MDDSNGGKKVSLKEKISLWEYISYGFGDFGCSIVYYLILSISTYYYTNVVGLSAALVGTIILVSSCLDGITDTALENNGADLSADSSAERYFLSEGSDCTSDGSRRKRLEPCAAFQKQSFLAFAAIMGISRAFYGKFGDKIDLSRFMTGSTILCIISYLIISFSSSPVFSLVGFGLCCLSVGILWPGSFSKASAAIRNGGTAMFAMLALAGDIGCAGGPAVVGFCTSMFNDNFHKGMLVGIVFPVCMLASILLVSRKKAGAISHNKK